MMHQMIEATTLLGVRRQSGIMLRLSTRLPPVSLQVADFTANFKPPQNR